jgi:DNA polymerase-3 subunit delta
MKSATGKGPTYQDLLAALANRRIEPLYLFYGEETFLIDEAVSRVVDAAIPEGDRPFNFEILSAGDLDVPEIIARASAYPMMAPRRVVVVREIERIPESGLGVLAHYVEQPSPETCLILVGTRADMRRKAFAGVRKLGMAIEFPELRDYQIPDWIVRRIEKRKGSIDPDAARLMASYLSSSLREIDNEIEKLFLYLGDRTNVTQGDVAAVVGVSREFNVFELQKSIGERNIPRSVEILERMLEANEPIPLLVSNLTSYFTKLWRLSYLSASKERLSPEQLAGTLRISPYFMKEYIGALERYTPPEISKMFLALAAADFDYKKGGADVKTIFHRLLLEILLPLHQREPA